MNAPINKQTKIIVINELRALYRNKRLLGLGLLGLLFYVVYSFSLMDSDLTEQMVILFLLVMGSFPGSTIGFAIFAKDGSYFDGLMSIPISVYSYVRAKLIFTGFFTLAHYLFLFVLALFVFPKYFFLLLGVLFYTLGVGIPLMVYCFSFNPKKINITGRVFLNYDGVSFWKPLVLIPPMSPLLFFENTYTLGIALMCISGISGFLFFNKWVALIGNRVKRQRYKWINYYRA